jgi:hypothetical protein
MDVDSLPVSPGDTLDFGVDIGSQLKNDQFIWVVSIKVRAGGPAAPQNPTAWNSEQDFRTAPAKTLSPLEQLTHVLLMSNECMFVD